MIRKAILITFVSTLFWSSSAICEVTIDFLSRWPYAPVKAIAVDNNEDPEWIFLGYGNFIDVLNVDLARQASKEITSSGQVMGIYYSAGYLYVACGSDGLKIIDVTDPPDLPDPAVYEISIDDPDLDARDVYVMDDYAYILEDFVIGVPKIEILDISDPTDPEKSGEVVFDTNYIAWGTWSETREITVSGGYAYVTDIINGLHIIDVSNPQDPAYVKAFLIENANVYGVDIFDPIAYVAGGGGGLMAVDISDPLTDKDKRVFGQYPDPLDEDTLIEAVGVHVVGDYAYVADRSGGLQVISASDPENLTFQGAFTAEMTGAYNVQVGGNYAYVKDDWTGLSKIDVVSDPKNPVLIADYDTPADAWDVFVSEEGNTITAYVVDTRVGTASNEEGLRIIDVSAALLPELKGFLATPGEAQGVFVADKYAYVADGTSGLRIIDVSDPTMPIPVSSLVTAGDAKDVFISENNAYVAEGAEGLQVINISDKDDPRLDSTIVTSNAQGVFVSGGYAYVADGSSGLRIFDVSVTPIAEVALVDTDNALAVYLSNSHAYVADGESGIKIIDVSSPAAPGTPVDLDTTDARGIFVMEDIALVADGAGGIRVVDISDPNNPQELRSWDTAGEATGVSASADFTYLADGAGGLVVLEHSFDPEPVPIEQEDIGGGGCFITTVF